LRAPSRHWRPIRRSNETHSNSIALLFVLSRDGARPVLSRHSTPAPSAIDRARDLRPPRTRPPNVVFARILEADAIDVNPNNGLGKGEPRGHLVAFSHCPSLLLDEKTGRTFGPAGCCVALDLKDRDF